MLHQPCGTGSSSLRSSRCACGIGGMHAGLTTQFVHVHGMTVRIMHERGCKAEKWKLVTSMCPDGRYVCMMARFSNHGRALMHCRQRGPAVFTFVSIHEHHMPRVSPVDALFDFRPGNLAHHRNGSSPGQGQVPAPYIRATILKESR